MAASKTSGLISDEPGALGVDEILKQVEQDDQEEWEYEYSTTETETYYLTLELSYPEFKERSTRVPHHSRGGYYKNWTDLCPADSTTIITRPMQVSGGGLSDDDGDDEPGGGGGDDDEPPVDPVLQATDKDVDDGVKSSEKEKETSPSKRHGGDEPMEDIQVLDLDSPNPIISYRGRIFEGQWAEVIGTEAILAHHDEEHPLPALRNLAEGVDILGASSSRILTKEKVLEPMVGKEDALAPIREEWNIRIPLGKDKTGERAHQIRFLENLIALKKKRGETDQVTVYATDGAGKDWNDRHGLDYKPRPKKGATLDDDKEEGGESGRKGGRRAASGRRRGSFGRRGRGGRGGAVSRQTNESVLSTATPSQWEELSRRDDEDERPDLDGGDLVEDDDVSMTGYD